MAVTYDKETDEIIISGFETGIAPSPLKGIANMQGVNISTETGEVMASYSRVQQSQAIVASSGVVAFQDSTHVILQASGGLITVNAGIWITVSGGGAHGLNDGTYYIKSISNSIATLSSYYNGATISGLSSGLSATFVTFRDMGRPVASATEQYSDGTSLLNRYYVLDANGLVWVQDTGVSTAGVTWFLPDTSTNYFSGTAPSGIAVLNGWLHVFAGNTIWVKSVINLGGTTSTSTTWVQMTNAVMMSLPTSTNPHFAYVGHQGKLYYTDGNYYRNPYSTH